MALYTFIMEYAGGTFISQVKASSPGSACVKWAENLVVPRGSGLGAKSKDLLVEQMKEEPPAALDGMSNAWCTTALLRGELALINLVRTEQ